MGRRMKRRIGFMLVIAMLIVMIYPGESGSASEESDGFVIENGVLTSYIGTENAVAIPDGITAIGRSAFQGSPIISVSIPGSVTSIGDHAFATCTALTSVSIPESVGSIGIGAFQGCTALGSVEILTGTAIPANAFEGCSGLHTVRMATSVPSIAEEAFKNCSSLASIAIPSGTSSIATNAFDGCTSMTAINVDPGNSYYETIDNMLYSKGGVALRRCPQGSPRGITIHEGTQVIDSGAFYGCRLGTINFPGSLTTVQTDAFTGSDIQELVLTAAVSTFDDQTFQSIGKIIVPGTSPVAGRLLEEYTGLIVETDYKPTGPDDPNNPGNTENPGGPDDPNNPGSTENPGDPNNPNNPDDPNNPNNPNNPNDPNNPGNTENPGGPDNPNDPDNPSGGGSEGGNGGGSGTGGGEGGTGGIGGTGGGEGGNDGSGGIGGGEGGNDGAGGTGGTGGAGEGGGNEGGGSGSQGGGSTGGGAGTGSGGAGGTGAGGGSTGGGRTGGGGTSGGRTGGTANKTVSVRTGIPYITGNQAISGWDAIYKYMKEASSKETVYITMNGETVVPARVLAQTQQKTLTLVLNMGEGFTWTVNGADIVSDSIKDIDFGVALNQGSVPEALQKDVAKESWSAQMRLAYDDLFGLTAVLTVSLGAEKAGFEAVLYYYDEKQQKMEYIDRAKIATSGDVSFSFVHASDYVIVVEGYPITGTTTTATADPEAKDDTPKTGPELNAKYIMCLGVMLLGIYMILGSRKEEERAVA